MGMSPSVAASCRICAIPATLKNDMWFGVVLDGMLKQAGMVAFAKEISRQDAAVIREYVIYRANQSLAESSSQKKP